MSQGVSWLLMVIPSDSISQDAQSCFISILNYTILYACSFVYAWHVDWSFHHQAECKFYIKYCFRQSLNFASYYFLVSSHHYWQFWGFSIACWDVLKWQHIHFHLLLYVFSREPYDSSALILVISLLFEIFSETTSVTSHCVITGVWIQMCVVLISPFLMLAALELPHPLMDETSNINQAGHKFSSPHGSQQHCPIFAKQGIREETRALMSPCTLSAWPFSDLTIFSIVLWSYLPYLSLTSSPSLWQCSPYTMLIYDLGSLRINNKGLCLSYLCRVLPLMAH